MRRKPGSPEEPRRPDTRPRAANEAVGRGWLVAIFVGALAYRALCFDVAGEHPLFRYPVVDAGQHDDWARRIVAGDWLGHGPDDVFKPPLYAYFLASLYTMFGHQIAVVQWVQFILGGLSAVLAAVLTGRWVGRTPGRIAGVLSALYAPYVFFECQLLTPALSIVLNLAALVLLDRFDETPRYARLLAAGALLGISAGVRADVLAPAALVLLYLVLRGRRLPWRPLAARTACVAVGVLAAISPILLRNYHLTRTFIPISSNSGINFYTGNAASADGLSAVPVGLAWERLVARVPQEILERPAEASRWWSRAAWDEMRAAPGPALARLGKKALAFFNRQEFRNNVCYHFTQVFAWPLRLTPFQYALVVPLAIPGLVSLARSRGASERRAFALCLLWVAGYWAVGVVFFVTDRFRLPAVPLLIPPAAWALARLGAAFRAAHWRTVLGYATGVVATGTLAWPLWFGSPERGWVRDYVNLANSRQAAGDAPGAASALRQALACDPNDPDANYLLGRSLLANDPAGALRHLRVAAAVMPDSPDVLLASAQACRALGDDTSARQCLSRLLGLADTSNLWPRRDAWANAHLLLADLDPQSAATHRQEAWSIDPRTTAEAAFVQRQELPRVLETFQAEARQKPWDWYSQANYGLALLETGRAAEAIEPLRKAAGLAPEREAIRFHLARALLAAGRNDEAARLLDALCRDLPPCPLRRQAQELRGRCAGPIR